MKYSLEPFNGSRLTNTEAAEFATRIISDYGSTPPPSPDVDEKLMQVYQMGVTSRLNRYDKSINHIRKNADTHLVANSDIDRDHAIGSFFSAVNTASTSDQPAELEAARHLNIVTKAYKGVARLNYESETKSIDTMVTELESAAYAPHVATLNLQRYVDRIKASNETFKALFTTRITATALTETFDVNNLRLALLDYCNEYAFYLVAMANATNNTFYAQQLSMVNAARKHYSNLIAHRKGVAAANDTTVVPPPAIN